MIKNKIMSTTIDDMKSGEEISSNCCGAPIYSDMGICSDCKEHCGAVQTCPTCKGDCYVLVADGEDDFSKEPCDTCGREGVIEIDL